MGLLCLWDLKHIAQLKEAEPRNMNIWKYTTLSKGKDLYFFHPHKIGQKDLPVTDQH